MNQLDFILWLQSFRSPVQMGAALGMITGCALERRYVRFPVHMPLGKQVVKVVIGLAVLVVLQMLLPRATRPKPGWTLHPSVPRPLSSLRTNTLGPRS